MHTHHQILATEAAAPAPEPRWPCPDLAALQVELAPLAKKHQHVQDAFIQTKLFPFTPLICFAPLLAPSLF